MGLETTWTTGIRVNQSVKFPKTKTSGDLDLPRQTKEPVIQCGYMRIGGGHGDATRAF